MVTTGTVVRRTAWAIVAICILNAPVQAQDRLVLGPYEMTASGAGFGATVGPAGALGAHSPTEGASGSCTTT